MEHSKRIDPPFAADEKTMLLGFLQWYRDTIVRKMVGLTDEQLRQPHQPSGLTLLGIVKHLADVERSWFREVVAGEDLQHFAVENDSDRYWRIEPDETTQDILDFYHEEIRLANDILKAVDLNAPTKRQFDRMPGLMNRWVVIHMIEETARHVGHVDMIREAIDGQTGE